MMLLKKGTKAKNSTYLSIPPKSASHTTFWDITFASVSSITDSITGAILQVGSRGDPRDELGVGGKGVQ